MNLNGQLIREKYKEFEFNMNETKTIKQHEENYWHIPKFSILPILGLILFTLLLQ